MKIANLSHLVVQHGDEVYGFCHKLACNKADADDLYQETFLKALEVCAKIDEDNNPKAFLISIAAGLWKNKRRKYAWRQRIAPTQTLEDYHSNLSLRENATPESITVEHEMYAAVHAATDGLKDKLKLPLYMYYTSDMSVEEIAAALNIPQGTVKSRLHKARKVIKAVLEENEYEEI